MAKGTTIAPTPTADELDAALGENMDELDAALDELGAENIHNTEETIDLCSLNLTNVLEMDYRLLVNGAWYDCEIVRAKGGRSKAGNLQAEFVYQVCDLHAGTDTEGSSLNGVTIFDQAGVDPRKPDMHWKIKKIAKRVGLLGLNDQIVTKNLSDFVGRKLRVQIAIDDKFNPERPSNKPADFAFPSEPNAAFTPSA